jgi:uncharacterized membrane protein/mono/diheme cytochrome c family protein
MFLSICLPALPSARPTGIILSLAVWLVPWLAGGPWDSPLAHAAEPGPYPAPREGPNDAGIDRAISAFRAHCVECHDLDGRGESGREMMRRVPDLTDSKWQDTRGDVDLARSIIEGKRTMPAMKSKLPADELESIVRLVRSFRDGKFQIPEDADEKEDSSSGQGEQAGAYPAEPEEAYAPSGFFQKLIRWLGKFHPPLVHFPIALLTAAAVAELLRLATGKPAFDAISRFCVMFGTLTAVVAGILGWFLGGFQVTDASWVMTVHRWIGTLTVALAVLVLVLSELSRRPARGRTRVLFRVTLFVAAALVSLTGFFGGALVYGINYHDWPR